MSRHRALKGCIAGMAGGLAATLVMTGFQSAWNALGNARAQRNNEQAEGQGSTLSERNSQSQPKQREHEQSNPTAVVADKIVAVTGHKLAADQKKIGGAAVHYGFGTLMGVLYGFGMERASRGFKRNPIRSGLLMGSSLFVAADEIALPLLRLTPAPNKNPMSSHLYGLASHLVYGATAGWVTPKIRKVI